MTALRIQLSSDGAVRPSGSDGHVVRGTLGGGDAALVVDLGGRDVPVSEKLWTLRISTPAPRSRVADMARNEWGE